MRAEASVQIHRRPEEVWAFVADHTNDPRWCSKVMSVEAAGECRWTVMHKPVPLRPPTRLVLEQLEMDPPRRLKLGEEDDASVFEVTYRLTPDGEGTRFTQISDFEWKKLPRLLHQTFARGVRRDLKRQLRDLKRVLEADPT